MTVKLLNQLLMVYIYSARLDETDKTIKCPNYHRAINPSLSTPHILLFWFYLFLSIRLLTKIFEYNFMVCVSYALTKKKEKLTYFELKWMAVSFIQVYPLNSSSQTVNRIAYISRKKTSSLENVHLIVDSIRIWTVNWECDKQIKCIKYKL